MAEKVHFQQLGQLQQNGRIECGLVEYLIYIGPTAIQFTGQPGNRTSLILQFLPDKLTDMYHNSVYVLKIPRLSYYI